MKPNVADDLQNLVKPIAELRLDPKNARKHGKRSVDALVRSLERFGQRKPVVVRDGVVLAGNGTLEAAGRLGWDGLACVEFRGTDAEARAYALADNRTAELSSWDKQLLADEVAELIDGGWGELDPKYASVCLERLAALGLRPERV